MLNSRHDYDQPRCDSPDTRSPAHRSTHMTPHIPQEIVDYIIDYLRGDNRSLYQCSLVCSAWLSSSSLHLFEQLTWPPCFHMWDFSRYTPDPSPPCMCNTFNHAEIWQQLLQFCRSASRVQFNVRRLDMCFRRHDSQTSSESAFPMSYPVSVSEMQDILESFPALQELHLVDFHLPSLGSEFPLNPPKTFSLEKLTFHRPKPFWSVFRLFDFVSTLSLLGCDPTPDHDDSLILNPIHSLPGRTRDKRCTVSSLVLEGGWPHVYKQYLPEMQSEVSFSSLHSLDCVSVIFFPRTLQDFLQSSPNLTRLAFDVTSNINLTETTLLLPNLDRLTIHRPFTWTIELGETTSENPLQEMVNLVSAALPFPSYIKNNVNMLFQLIIRAEHSAVSAHINDVEPKVAQAIAQAIDLTLLATIVGEFKTTTVNLMLLPSLSLSPATLSVTLSYLTDIMNSRMPTQLASKIRLHCVMISQDQGSHAFMD